MMGARVMATAAALMLSGTAMGQSLKVGDKAPALSVEKWIKGAEVKGLEPGHAYVIEFWATWCGPCIKAMPHLTELQKEYPGVTIIGVAGSERGEASAALTKLESWVKNKGDEMGYAVAYDSDRSMSNTWMVPAGQNGIPCSFVVDAKGIIRYIGHPMAGLDDAIKQVAAGAAPAGDVAKAVDRPYDLMVGDKAPTLSVGKWVKGDPVSEFEKNKTYVVEFWAEWCGPCRASIPHLTELQAKYKDKGVTVIGVNVWDTPEKAEPFVAAQGDKMAYTVVLDDVAAGQEPDAGKMATGWMKAAGQNGIPAAFIVDDGRVAWIGHPMGMDEPLASIVAGTWDLDAEAKHYAEQIAEEAKEMAAMEALESAMMSGDRAKAIKEIDRLLAEGSTNQQLMGTKYMLLIQDGQHEAASAYGRTLVEGPFKDEPMMLNQIAWMLVDPEGDVEKPDLELAHKAAARAVEATHEKDGSILDTLARVLFLKGDLEHAVTWQAKAAEASAGQAWEAEVKQRLDEYKAALAKRGG